MRDMNTAPGGVEAPAVVYALYIAIDDAAVAQSDHPVRAAVFERADVSCGGSKQHDRLSPDFATQQPLFDLGRLRDHVPTVRIYCGAPEVSGRRIFVAARNGAFKIHRVAESTTAVDAGIRCAAAVCIGMGITV
jgi:hypothetical protein